MFQHRIGGLLLTALAAVSGPALLGGTAAQAAPSGCQASVRSGGAVASCSQGTGTFRVVLGCERPDRTWYYRYGAWLSPGGGQSTATCVHWYEAKYAAVQKRN